MNGIVLTREALLRLAGFNPAKELKRSHGVIVAAHEATLDEGEPDHPTRLKAADLNLKLADAYPKRDADPDATGRPIAVNLIFAVSDTRPAIPSHGVRLHFEGDHGAGT